MSVLHLLAQDNFITYNKVVAKKYGVNTAILLGALCSYQSSFKNEEFYKEQEKIKEDTCLSVYEIQQALKVLVEANLVKVTKKGLPAKNYYYILENKLCEVLITSGQNFRPLEVENLDDINNNTINNNTINNKDIQTNEIFDYWNSKNIIKHSKLRPTIKKQIDKVLKEYTKDDVKQFIDRYAQVIKDKNYYFDTKWTLEQFLKQSNAMKDFTDEGSKWVNYKTHKKSATPTHEHAEESYDNLFANIDEIKF